MDRGGVACKAGADSGTVTAEVPDGVADNFFGAGGQTVVDTAGVGPAFALYV